MKRLKRLLETQKELMRIKKIDKAVALLIKTGAIKKVRVDDLEILKKLDKSKGIEHKWFIDTEVLFRQ